MNSLATLALFFPSLHLALVLVACVMIAVLFSICLMPQEPKQNYRRLGRHMVRDISYQFQMLGLFPGDVNRAHPFNIEANLIDVANPPGPYGSCVFADPSGAVRAIQVGDTTVYGVTPRPYPTQQTTVPAGTNALNSPLGVAYGNASGITDVLKQGYIGVPVYGGVNPNRFGAVYMWNQASANGHVLGGLEASPTAGSTVQIPTLMWAGGQDAGGTAELIVR